MTRWVAFIGIVLAGIAAMVVSERNKVDVEASPAAILYFVADAEREITRIPMQMTRMSDEDEISAGNELAQQYQSAFHLSDDDTSEEQYIQQVGARVAEHAHRRLPYQFHYLPDPNFINAFALPGGQVFIGKGLVSLMDTEDELAVVLGHEVEHIDQRHCAERTQQEQIFRKIPLGELAEIPVEVFEAGYTKVQELQADSEGTQLAVAAGYSGSGAIHMFETFEQFEEKYSRHASTPGEEMSQVTIEALEGYFRSHPMPEERIAQLQQMHLPSHAERPLKVRPAVIKP